MKKLFMIMLISVFLLTVHNVYAFEIVTDTYEDTGFISSSFLKTGRDTDRTVRYSPWLINYAIQTEEEAQVVKGGEGFQQISDIAISPVDNNLMIMGTDTCGIWRSEDGGENWLSVNDGVNCWGVHDIIFHPSQKNIVYMIQGGPNASVPTSQIQGRSNLDGLYKSEDGGKSWRQILDVNIRASVATNRLIAFDDSLNLYLLTDEGLLRSDDSGETWVNLYSINEESVNYDLCISGNTIVFTNDTYGVFASEDSGLTWEMRNLNSDGSMSAYGLDIDPENSSHWLVCLGLPYYEVYETFDSGRNWTVLHVGADTSADSGKHPRKIMFGKRVQNGVRSIYMLFSQTYTPLRVSFDEGATWSTASYTTPWGSGYSPYYGNAISLEHNDAGTVFLGVGTVMKSIDGGQTFTVRNTPGYSGANVEKIKFSDSGRLYLSTTDRGYYKSTAKYEKEVYPTFQHTRDQNYSDVGDIGIDPKNESHIIYAECRANGFALRESNDGGLTWSKINGTEASAAPSVIKFHSDKDIIYSTYFTSRDRGNTWTPNEKSIHAVSEIDNDVVYSLSGKKLYKSSDCGITFSELFTAEWKITYILPDNVNADIVYIGLQNGNIVKIESGQATVMNENNGLSNVSPREMAQNPDNPQHIVMGGQCVDYSKTNKDYYNNYCKTPGLYETYDGGITWHIVKGMPSMRVVYSLAFSHSSSEIFIGGFTGGLLIYDYEIYRKYLSSENSIDESFTVIYNGVTRKVTVSGKIKSENNDKKYSTLLVMPAEVMPKNANINDIVYLGQVEVDDDGAFEYTFSMPPDCDYGMYSVYLGGSGIYLPGVGEYDNLEFSIVSFEFEDTQDITATASFLNTTKEPENIVLYLAQYETDDTNTNRLIDIKSEHHTIPNGSNDIVTKKITSSLDEQTDLYRAFLWSDDGSLKPLTGCIENKVNGE